MKRTKIFTLVMAIFWSVIGVLALVLAAHTPDLDISMKVVLVFLVFVAVVGNWLRWYKTR